MHRMILNVKEEKKNNRETTSLSTLTAHNAEQRSDIETIRPHKMAARTRYIHHDMNGVGNWIVATS